LISPGGSRWTNRILTWPKKPVFKNGLVFLSPDRRKRDIGVGATSGSGGGFAMFDAWSRRSAKYDARYTMKVWDGFERSPPSRIGMGTIIHLATDAVQDWADRLDDEDPEALAVVAAFAKLMDE
jgi:Primase C terminal 2 (PriCT-2)